MKKLLAIIFLGFLFSDTIYAGEEESAIKKKIIFKTKLSNCEIENNTVIIQSPCFGTKIIVMNKT